MAEIEVERTEPAHPIVTYVSDPSGPVTGLTVLQSVYDPDTNQWMNMTTGAFQATKDTGLCIEEFPGSYMRRVNVTQTNVATQMLLAEAEITAGSSGVGQTSGDVIRLVRNYKTLPDEAAIRSFILSDDTPFDGANIDAAISSISTPVIDMDGIATAVWTKLLTGLSAPGNAAEALLAAGGGNTPEAIADAVLSALTIDYENADGSVGQSIYNSDATTLSLLLKAAIGQLSRFGRAYGSVPLQKLFVGDIDEIFRRPILIDGKLADLTGAAIQWRFIALDDGTEVTQPGTVSGTPGHAEYKTFVGDGIIDGARSWRGYAVATMPDLSVKTSERMVIEVRAVV